MNTSFIARRGGLTLLELLIILAAVLIIIFIALPTLKPTEEEATIDFVKEQLLYLHAREQEFYAQHGRYAPLSEIAADERIGARFDRRFASDNPLVGGVTFNGPQKSGVTYNIIAVLPDGSRYQIDQTGEVKATTDL